MNSQILSTPRPFTPLQEAPADLDRRTVGRNEILSALAQRLATAATGRSRPHTLLVGPRGSGKTHLLRVALHRLDQNPDIRSRLAVADISEDAVGLTRYADLVWEIGASLGLTLPRSTNAVDLEDAVLDFIDDKTLVLVLENLDRVFSAIGRRGQQNLRSWVETSGRILLMAATPVLFAGVADRTQPWFAGMITTPLEGLSAEAGHELLTILARQRGDDALAEFLQTGIGRGRVEAIARLTGGSPRIWMVLSEILTVDALDALVPAVEALIESLVPYYQQLLWDLPPNHQAVVRQLAEGPGAALTAADIAGATGLSQQTVSKALSLLQDSRWVSAEKVPDADRRKTWYSLREPMLRHHFQWRTTGGEPLRLIVELLRAWYQPHELRRQLAGAQPHGGRSTDTLIADARRWTAGDSDVFTVDCGRYVLASLALMCDRKADIAADLAKRLPTSDMDEDVVRVLTSRPETDLASMLRRLVEVTGGNTKAGLALVAARRIGPEDAEAAYNLLVTMPLEVVTSRATALAVQVEAQRWLSRTGHTQESLTATLGLMPQLRALGDDHPVTLIARFQIASWTGELGDVSSALDLYRDLLVDSERVLGQDHPATLGTRADLAVLEAGSGRVDEAVELAMRGRVMASTLLEVLLAAPHAPSAPGLPNLLWHAFRGDSEAAARLPAELRELAATAADSLNR